VAARTLLRPRMDRGGTADRAAVNTRRLESLEMLGKGARPAVRRRRRTCTCIGAAAVALQDVLTAIRLKTPIERGGLCLVPNGERCLRPLPRLRNFIRRH